MTIAEESREAGMSMPMTGGILEICIIVVMIATAHQAASTIGAVLLLIGVVDHHLGRLRATSIDTKVVAEEVQEASAVVVEADAREGEDLLVAAGVKIKLKESSLVYW